MGLIEQEEYKKITKTEGTEIHKQETANCGNSCLRIRVLILIMKTKETP